MGNLDFDSGIRRFGPSRPSQFSRVEPPRRAQVENASTIPALAADALPYTYGETRSGAHQAPIPASSLRRPKLRLCRMMRCIGSCLPERDLISAGYPHAE